MKTKNLLVLFLLSCCLSASYGQTILAPDLQCVVNNNTNGDITLFWTNPPVNPCGSFVQYTIYGSSSGVNGPYDSIAVVASQTATSAVLTNYLAASPNWYFYMEANYNCPGATILKSDTVDNRNPTTPFIINVTVTPGEDVIFNWEPSPSPQTAFYIVYYYLPNGNSVPLDTVYGRFNTTYTDTQADPTIQSLVYTVAAVDSCGSISAFNTEPHNTVWLQSSTTACQNQINLVWNKYNNWPIGVKEYQIFASINLGPYNQVGSVDSNSTSYAFSAFIDGDSVCLFVRAISGDDTTVVSNSNINCLRASIIQPPSYIFITNATVDLNHHISVTWMIDTMAELTFYKIERSGNGLTYKVIDQLSAPATLNFFETYIDSAEVMPEHNPYFYEITAVDSCQNQYRAPFVKTVHLDGELFDYYIANLEWNDFELQGATVLRYNLYRDYGFGYQLIKTLPFGITEYSDSLQQFLDEQGTFCYRIEAVYDLSLSNGYTATLSSWSNVKCIIHRPIIYIPNAFRPGSTVAGNNVFKPTMHFAIEPKAYLMQIYNRWGGLVFETRDSLQGWDGTDHGKEAQQGGYAYLIQFYSNDEVRVERKGMVLLVR